MFLAVKKIKTMSCVAISMPKAIILFGLEIIDLGDAERKSHEKC
jgi:hypothetical protein